MGEGYSDLTALLGRIRNRWRALTALRAWGYAAGAAALVLGFALLIHWLIHPEGGTLVSLWSAAGALVVAVLLSVVATLRRAPRDLQIARFIEEQCPELEDSLVTAISERASGTDAMAAAVVSDAVRRARRLEVDGIISRLAVRRVAILAIAASIALLLAAAFSAGPAGQAADVVGVYLFPDRLALAVTPGDAKIRAGEPLRVVARISGGAAIVPVLRVGADGEWRETRMEAGSDGFDVIIERVEHDFRYAVTAAGTSSREYAVTVVHPPRVERIDLRYEYPSGFGMPAREEEDGGDIYGPAGTRVRVTVHADKPVRHAALNLTGAKPIVLSGRDDALVGELTITEDGSYRIALADADGLANPGDTEYFIRTLQDRPPDVRIVRPASDRQVTPIEEVSIEASADDDFGVAALDLVYTIRGGEKVVPFTRNGSGTAVTGHRTVYLEDLGVRPGDFVAYYARARDVSRGKRSSEARSDIFFLEVTPFEEEFVASQSQGMGGGSGDEKSLEDLIQAQKDIITATWNLDRRGREAGGRSQDDIRAVARAQRDLRSRTTTLLTEMQRAGEMRRRRLPGGRGGQVNADAMGEAIGRAIQSMGSANQQLDALKTTEALPHEMTALNELLRAQAEVRRREIQQQQANGTGGRGSNRQQQDLSSLFDHELARQQQTNYETPQSRETREEQTTPDEALDEIRELARRQEALNRSEQELARKRNTASPEELRRELERLTREQSELRRQAEELARELQQAAKGQQGGSGRQGGQGQAGDSRQQASRDLQQASEEMQGAASELRRENPQQASARGNRAAERLRDVEQRMRGAQPDDRRRAAGELQLESRQLADAQRRLGGEAGRSGEAGDRADRARRRASEQERLAERAERLEQAVRQLAGRGADPKERGALGEAVQEIDRSRPSQRMRDAARSDRQSAEAQSGQVPNGRGDKGDGGPASAEASTGKQQSAQSRTQQEREEIARGLDRLADRLGAAGGQSPESQQLTEELSRLRQLREELAGLDRQLSELRAGADGQKGDQTGRGQQSGQSGRGARPGGTGQNVGAEAPWEEVREMLNDLQRENPAMAPDADGFNPGRSAPGTEGWKQDFAKWDQLKVQLAAALERAERTAADRLREQQSRDRLNAGATQAVPEQYRRLVERYYRALAAGSEGR